MIHTRFSSCIANSRSTQVTRGSASGCGIATTRFGEILNPNLARIGKITACAQIHGCIDTTQERITTGIGTRIGSRAVSGGIEITFSISFVTGEEYAGILLTSNVETFALRDTSSGVDVDTLTSGGITSGVLASQRLSSLAVRSKIIIKTSTSRVITSPQRSTKIIIQEGTAKSSRVIPNQTLSIGCVIAIQERAQMLRIQLGIAKGKQLAAAITERSQTPVLANRSRSIVPDTSFNGNSVQITLTGSRVASRNKARVREDARCGRETRIDASASSGVTNILRAVDIRTDLALAIINTSRFVICKQSTSSLNADIILAGIDRRRANLVTISTSSIRTSSIDRTRNTRSSSRAISGSSHTLIILTSGVQTKVRVGGALGIITAAVWNTDVFVGDFARYSRAIDSWIPAGFI